jgi:hypothetical protein
LKLLYVFLLLLLVQPVFSETFFTNSGFSPYINANTPSHYLSANPNKYNCYNNTNLNALEKYTFNRNYPRETKLQRLERLESIAFGAVQQGDIDTRYQNVERAILARPKNDYYKKQGLFNVVRDYYKGVTTGITPSVTYQGLAPYDNPYDIYNRGYNPNYGTQRIDNFSNGIFGNGYRVLNQNFGTGSSVKIID